MKRLMLLMPVRFFATPLLPVITGAILCLFPDRSMAQHPLPSVDYVNTVIGTSSKGKGGTIPAVGPPFAMTNFTAQTDQNKISRMPYVYESSSIIGFMGTHQPAVWMGDYGYVSVMPQTGKLGVLPEERSMKFRHDEEEARPFFYKVKMRNAAGKIITAEMTATERCGLMRFTFPESPQSHLIVQGINLTRKLNDRVNNNEKRFARIAGYIHIDTINHEISGYNPDRASYDLGPELKNFKGYFVIRFNRPFTVSGTWSDEVVKPQSTEQSGKRIGAYISFPTAKDEQVMVKVATSFISVEQAKENMSREIPAWDFEGVAKQTKEKWQSALDAIQLGAADDERRTVFYTALYHTLLYPRDVSEYGSYYSAFDDQVHEGISYTDFSLWDTFRAQHPLLILLTPERVNGMIRAMLQMYQQGGWLPMWPNPAETNIMIGTHADAVIADAYVKGLRDYDTALAYEAMRKNAFTPPDNDTKRIGHDREAWNGYEVRTGLSYYHSLGYVPSDIHAESVSRTLEYALDDYCVAQVAKGLQKHEDYKRLMSWSENYKNVFNRSTGFMAPRLYNGQWEENVKLGFTEGSPWTYLFCVMQDIPGMIELMGGKEKFNQLLDSNFLNKHYVHENEPGHHYPYLYVYSGQPWKTQELIRKLTTENYFNKAEGINGNDDCGQMSAWYLFSVMGFYPVTPASGVYAIGAPQFPDVVLQLTVNGEKRKLEIQARHLSEENKYVQQVSLNGKPLNDLIVSHEELMKGGVLLFEMGSKPAIPATKKSQKKK